MFFLVLSVFINWFVISILLGPNWGTVATAIIIILSLSPIAEKINRFSFGCRPATKEEQALVEKAWNTVLTAAKEKNSDSFTKLPELFVSDQQHPNAFAMGSKTVCVTRGLLRVATPEELTSVLAHELGHLHYGDSRRRSVAVAMNWAGNVASWVLVAFTVILDAFSGQRFFLLTIIALILKGFLWLMQRAADLGILAVGRKEEFRADEYAKELGFASGLVSFLRKIDSSDMQPVGLWAALSRTHPPTAVRIDRLTD